ncbi:IS3 family transposase [Bacillus sp. FSL K6-3431]|uniref:IS3 family transposase n=1 Tax=Bacillus sp. FSL K6-3431 TaxID=2921500 RepID=UPI004046D726
MQAEKPNNPVLSFIRRHFHTLEQLALELFDYVHWYNNIRMHSSIDYLSPIEYRNLSFKKTA